MRFTPRHNFQLDENGLRDEESLSLLRDAQAVWRSLYQGMLPEGNWLEDRVGWLVEQWLPGWQVSHAQVADLQDLALQSRSWDLTIHRPDLAELGLPPAARPDGRYAPRWTSENQPYVDVS